MADEVQVLEADVPFPMYDEWKRVIVLPRGLTEIEQGRAMRELFAERRGGRAFGEPTSVG